MSRIKHLLSGNTLILIAAAMLMFCSLYNGSFLTAFNIGGLLMEIAFMSFLAVGMTFVILTGGIDLSVGAVAGLSTVIVAITMKNWDLGNDMATALMGSVVALAVCTSIGLINGLFITKLRLPPLIVTLGMTWVTTGIGQTLLKGSPIQILIKGYKTILTYKLGGWIPVTFLLAVAVLLFLVNIFKKYRFGREFYAVGSNQYAAFISGTKTDAVLRKAYILCSLLAGLSGLLIAAYTGSGYPGAANNYELYTIAAVVMGGISLTGGEGKLHLAFFGVIILRLLNKVFFFTGLSSVSGFIEGIIIGTILIAVLLINASKSGGETK